MKKNKNKLQELYKGNMLAELPLSLSLLSPPPVNKNDDKRRPKLTPCSFYRAIYYHCQPPFKLISRIIDPDKD